MSSASADGKRLTAMKAAGLALAQTFNRAHTAGLWALNVAGARQERLLQDDRFVPEVPDAGPSPVTNKQIRM